MEECNPTFHCLPEGEQVLTSNLYGPILKQIKKHKYTVLYNMRNGNKLLIFTGWLVYF